MKFFIICLSVLTTAYAVVNDGPDRTNSMGPAPVMHPPPVHTTMRPDVALPYFPGNSQWRTDREALINLCARAFPKGINEPTGHPSSSCSANLTEPSGLLMSPDYPNSYQGPRNCTYRITAPPGQIISLSISDIDLERSNQHSIEDSLKIFDGDQEILPIIDKLTGSEYFSPSRTYNSTTNQLLIRFQTSSSTGMHRGFHATYRMIPVKCGGEILRSDSGTIDHSFSAARQDVGTCKWIIQAPPGHVVRLTRKQISVVDRFDYFKPREWKNNSFVKFWLITNHKTYDSTEPIVYIEYGHAYSGHKFRYQIDYQFVRKSSTRRAEKSG